MRRFAILVALGCTQSPPAPVHTVASAPVPSTTAVPAAVVVEVQPAKEPEPVYDLAADLEARKKTLLSEVGGKTKFQTVEGVFLIAAPSGQLGSSAVVTKQALEAYFNNRFARRPDRALAVLLFETAPPYNAYCKTHWGKECSTPFGFYASDVRTVVMNVGPGIGTLTHELVHPIVEADFPKAPDWINEGIASLYEAFSMPKKGDIRGHKNFRHSTVLTAIQAKKSYASVSALFGMTDEFFRGAHEGVNYATARYFCQWMDSQKKLWPFYQAWRDNFAKDPTGEKAFVATMGKKPAELDAAWAQWVKSL
jgi:hypothetical protein